MNTEHPSRRTSMTALWRQPAARVGAIAALALLLAVVAYLAAALLLVPRIVADAIASHLAAAPQRALDYERLGVNPFTLSVELTGVTGIEPLTPAAFNAARVVLDLDFTTLFTGRLRVAAFDVERGELRLRDSPDGSPRERVVTEIEVRARELERNGLAGGRYTARIGNFVGGHIQLAGELGDSLTAGSGRLVLAGLDLTNLQPWVPLLEPLAPQGRLDLTGEYRWPVRSDRSSLEIERGRVTVSGLNLTAAPNLSVRAESLTALATSTITARGTTLGGSLLLELTDAHLEIVNSHMTPPLVHAVERATGTVAAASTPPEIEIELEGVLADDARSPVTLTATLGALEHAFVLTVTDANAASLSPYALAAVDRELTAGRIDLDLAYAYGDERAMGRLGVLTSRLELGAAAGATSLELAQALLEDEHGALTFEVPLTSDGEKRAEPAVAIAAAIRARIDELVATPLATLAPLVNADATTLGRVPFEPGIAAVAPSGAGTLDTLAELLRRRPRLGLHARGGFDWQADRDALARQQVELHVSLATAGPTLRARPEPIDFGSARAQDVLDEFAGERLAAERIAEIAARSPFAAASPSTTADRLEYYRAIFDALVANETIGAGALRRIGRYRAQAIGEALAARGIARERVAIGDGTGSAAPDDERAAVFIPIELAMPPSPVAESSDASAAAP